MSKTPPKIKGMFKTLEIHKQDLFIYLTVLHKYKYLTILSSKLHTSNLARNF